MKNLIMETKKDFRALTVKIQPMLKDIKNIDIIPMSLKIKNKCKNKYSKQVNQLLDLVIENEINKRLGV